MQCDQRVVILVGRSIKWKSTLFDFIRVFVFVLRERNNFSKLYNFELKKSSAARFSVLRLNVGKTERLWIANNCV